MSQPHDYRIPLKFSTFRDSVKHGSLVVCRALSKRWADRIAAALNRESRTTANLQDKDGNR